MLISYMPKRIRFLNTLIFLGIVASYCSGAVYYIDFDNGNDESSGSSIEEAWKHCPGDSNAKGLAKSSLPKPGDVYHFKGGVIYRGQLNATRSGVEDNPIIYDGNSDGSWGTGRAIIDGTEPLLGWTQCASAEEADGNPAWEQIYWTYLPANSTAYSNVLFEDGELLHVAQDPNVLDPFWWDDRDLFLDHDWTTDTTIVDADYLNQADPEYWSGSTYVYIHGGNNIIYTRKLTGYDPAAHRIEYEPLGVGHLSKYAMANSLQILDAPGELVVREDQKDANNRVKVYLMPLTPGIEGKIISRTTESVAISLGSQSHLVVRGFILQGSNGGDSKGAIFKSIGSSVENLQITDNVIRNVGGMGIRLHTGNRIVISDNTITLCGGRGILLSKVTNASVRNNNLDKNAGTGIGFYGAQNSDISNNILTSHLGNHANGLTVYLDSSDILVFGNWVTGGRVAFTVQSSTNVTVAYNVLDGGEEANYALADWGGVNGLFIYNNYVFNAAVAIGKSSRNIVSKNNIMPGSRIKAGGGISENNIYTGNQTGELGTGEFLATEAELFVNPGSADYRLKSNSPAIDKGVDVGFETDSVGNPVPQGAAPDIGPFEYFTSNWRGLTGADGNYETPTRLGWVYADEDPWIWSYNLEGWIYMQTEWDDLSTTHNGWIYILRQG